MCAFTELRTAAANEWYVSCICVYLLLPQPCVCAAVILLPPVYVCRSDTAVCVVCVYQRVLVTAVPICFYYCQRACRVCVPWGVQVYNYYHSCHRMCTHFATAAYTNMHIFLVCPK